MSEEDSKQGFMLSDVEQTVREIATYNNLHIKGLMTIAPYVENPEENRSIF